MCFESHRDGPGGSPAASRRASASTRTDRDTNLNSHKSCWIFALLCGRIVAIGTHGTGHEYLFVVPEMSRDERAWASVKFEQIPLFYPRGCAAPLREIAAIATLERFIARASRIYRPRPRARPRGHGELLKLLRLRGIGSPIRYHKICWIFALLRSLRRIAALGARGTAWISFVFYCSCEQIISAAPPGAAQIARGIAQAVTALSIWSSSPRLQVTSSSCQLRLLTPSRSKSETWNEPWAVPASPPPSPGGATSTTVTPRARWLSAGRGRRWAMVWWSEAQGRRLRGST